MPQPFEPSESLSVRPPRPGAAPAVAVVVASTQPEQQLGACLASLVPQCRSAVASLVVVRADSADAVAGLRAAYPSIQVIAAPHASSRRELRRLGMLEAHADIIALTDDDQVREADWVNRLRSGRLLPENGTGHEPAPSGMDLGDSALRAGVDAKE